MREGDLSPFCLKEFHLTALDISSSSHLQTSLRQSLPLIMRAFNFSLLVIFVFHLRRRAMFFVLSFEELSPVSNFILSFHFSLLSNSATISSFDINPHSMISFASLFDTAPFTAKFNFIDFPVLKCLR